MSARTQLLAALAGSARTRPPARSRADICRVRYHFQGLTIHSQAYGDLPWFPAALTSFEAELDALLDQLVAAGDTHCQIDLKWDYGEPGQPYGSGQLVPPMDLTGDLPHYLAISDRVIDRGLIPMFVLLAEGQSGLRWIFDNLDTVTAALDWRLAYGPLCLFYDGGWPATFSVSDMKRLLPFCRAAIQPDGYLCQMFANGPAGSPYLWVQNENDFAQPWMQALDIILTSTNPDQVQCPALVNYAQYMLGPNLRPQSVCTPQWHGPYVLGPGTPRGPYFWGVVEWRAYQWVRKWVSAQDIAVDRARMESVGIEVHG